MAGILWLRQEVFNSVLPNLSYSGRNLANSLVLDVIKQLSKVQTPDHMISFDRWLVVAKDFLKWNDNCIRLFWEMLHVAIWSKLKTPWTRHSESISIEYVALFLVMHIQDSQARPSSPKAAYDTAWPGADSAESITSPPSPKSPSRAQRQSLANVGSPKSPRSPRSPSTTLTSVSSPKRSMLISSRQGRSIQQILHSIRQKIPLLLRAVCPEDADVGLEGLCLGDGDGGSSHVSGGEILLSRKAINSLGLLLCGGWSRDREVRPLWSVFPNSAQHVSVSNDWTPCFAFADVVSWIDSKLSANELLYPNPSPVLTSSPRFRPGDADSPSSPSTSSNAPVRELYPLSSLSQSSPLAIAGFNHSTYIHLVTAGPTRGASSGAHSGGALKAEPKGLSVHISETDGSSTAGTGGEASDADAMSECRGGGSGEDKGDDDSDSQAAFGSGGAKAVDTAGERGLPHLNLQGCERATLYFLSPFASASLSGCCDCVVVLSAVSGVVLLSSCERLHITVACAQLVARNCLDCAMNVASLSFSPIVGDSRGLTFGPFNCSFRHHKTHLQLAGLSSLLQPCSAWSSLCDVNAVVDSPSSAASPSGYALDTTQFDGTPLPTPQESTASVLPPEKFVFVSVPLRGEHLGSSQSAVPITPEYAAAISSSVAAVSAIQAKLLAGTGAAVSSPNGKDSEVQPADQLASTTRETTLKLSKHFTDWLISSGKSQHLLDLIRLDAEAGSRSSGLK